MTAEQTPDPIEMAALDWVIRLREPGFDAWEVFEAWLEADPAHARVYQEMAVAEVDVGPLVAAVPVARAVARPLPVLPGRRVSRAWFGGAIAASLAVVATTLVLQNRPDPYLIKTAAGSPRSVVLVDGTRLDLNGGTQLLLDRKEPRQAVLKQGEVVFTVVHDDQRPFRVGVGEASLVDVGTVFNVARTGTLTTVAVSEGAVVFNPDGEAVHLPAGRSLRAVDGSGPIVLANTPPSTIGSWRTGQLVYDGAVLADVAADLSRGTGLVVVADPAVAGRKFRGVISLGAGRRELPAGLGPLLGVRVVADGAGWRMAAEAP